MTLTAMCNSRLDPQQEKIIKERQKNQNINYELDSNIVSILNS